MKAIVQDKYGSPGDVLSLREIDKPMVKDDEVLVRVHAASVHPDVWHVVRGMPYILRIMGAGLLKPKNSVPGTDVAGHVESVGKNVTRFQPGDEVFGESVRGHQWHNGGAYAEYVSVPEDALASKPNNITFEQAAAVPTSGLIALQNLPNRRRLQRGQKVLINGAGGGVGAIALQLAKSYGANVTGVEDTKKLDMVRSLGADRVIDYTQEDFTQSDELYDLIFDIPGNHPFSDCRRALTPEGTYVLIGHDQFGDSGGRWLGSLPHFFKLVVMSPFVSQLPDLNLSMPSKKDSMAVMKEFLEAGKITPVIDRSYPLSEVPEAIRYLEEGHAQGKVVITIWGADHRADEDDRYASTRSSSCGVIAGGAVNAPGYVYLMVSKPLDFHKIGMTTDHPEAPRSELTGRLRWFPKWYFDLPHGVQPTRGQRSVANPLRILWYAPASNPREAEKALHAMFWHRQVDKRRRRTALDWFALTDEDVETICAMQGDKFCL